MRRGYAAALRSDFEGPVNIGSEEMVTINQLADMIMAIAGKRLGKRHIPGPVGVRGRNSDNRLIEAKLGWRPSQPLSARPCYNLRLDTGRSPIRSKAAGAAKNPVLAV